MRKGPDFDTCVVVKFLSLYNFILQLMVLDMSISIYGGLMLIGEIEYKSYVMKCQIYCVVQLNTSFLRE
jgi:hypothetical protein